MFNFLRKKDAAPKELVPLAIHTDIHSHILAGIDDGSPDIETSLDLVRGLLRMGIRESIATPHIIGDMFRNNPVTINAALDKLKQACKNEGLEIKLGAAAEYLIDDYFLGLISSGDPLLTIKDNLLLTEMMYTAPPENLEEFAFSIITAGYQPIMAHPERYFYYHKNYEEYYKLKDLGFMLQVNLLSITGYYGGSVAKAANFILDKGLADYVGTDMHHERHMNSLLNNASMINRALEGKVYNHF